MKKMFFFGLLVAALVFSLLSCDGDGNGNFVSSTNDMTLNNVPILGLVGTTASSSNTNVATVETPPTDKIKITSVAEGSAVITVKNALDHTATINVTVAKNGTIAIGTIIKYVASNEKTIVGNWTKTVDSNIGELTVNLNNTWSLSFNATPLVSNGTWDENYFSFIYDYDSENPQQIDLSYVLSANKNQLSFSGEGVNLIGGSDPWDRFNPSPYAGEWVSSEFNAKIIINGSLTISLWLNNTIEAARGFIQINGTTATITYTSVRLEGVWITDPIEVAAVFVEDGPLGEDNPLEGTITGSSAGSTLLDSFIKQ